MTFGPDIEYWLLRHFFKGVSFPTLPQCYMVLLESYPGIEIPQEGYYEAFPVYPDDWSVIYDATYGKLLTNNIEFWFYAESDFPADVGGWVLIFSPPLPSGKMYFAEAVVTPKPVYAGDYVVFSPGDLTIGQNGGLLPGHFTDYAEEKLLKQAFELEDFPTPDIWVGLLHDDPTDAGTNANCNEVSWQLGGYHRVATSHGDWEIYGWGVILNDNAIMFPRAEQSWGTVKYFGLFDAETPSESGHLLIYGALIASWPPAGYPVSADPITVKRGAALRFDVDKLAVRFSV